jgi:hypothetical protein
MLQDKINIKAKKEQRDTLMSLFEEKKNLLDYILCNSSIYTDICQDEIFNIKRYFDNYFELVFLMCAVEQKTEYPSLIKFNDNDDYNPLKFFLESYLEINNNFYKDDLRKYPDAMIDFFKKKAMYISGSATNYSTALAMNFSSEMLFAYNLKSEKIKEKIKEIGNIKDSSRKLDVVNLRIELFYIKETIKAMTQKVISKKDADKIIDEKLDKYKEIINLLEEKMNLLNQLVLTKYPVKLEQTPEQKLELINYKLDAFRIKVDIDAKNNFIKHFNHRKDIRKSKLYS